MLDSVIRFERRNRLSFPYMDDPDRDDSMFEERQQEARNYLATLVKLSDSFVLLGTKQSETDDSKLAEEMIDSLLQARVDLKRENMSLLRAIDSWGRAQSVIQGVPVFFGKN